MAATLSDYGPTDTTDGGTVFEHPSLQLDDRPVEVAPTDAECCAALGCHRGDQLYELTTPSAVRVFCIPHAIGYLHREGYL